MARGWCCFKFWCCYRLLTAFVTHLNLVNALYVNCAYFTLWKAYDILWFWMHAILCACIPAVRPDNFFVVSCTLIWKKRTKYPKRSYMEIYDLLYNFKRAELQNLVSSDSSQRVPEASALSYAPSSDESDPDEMHNESVERGRSLSASIMKKRLRKEQKKEARGIERKRQNISHAVELLLQSLRLKISYAIIMGNLVRILAQFKKELPESSTEESIHVMVISTSLIFLDVAMCLVSSVRIKCTVLCLCCRLGFCKFYLWALALTFVCVFLMKLPMLYVFGQLDDTLCHFKPNTTLSQYW